jgi:hypothetical protein
MAIGLCVYHSVASTILFQAPRFIPYSFGPFMEQSVYLCLNFCPSVLIEIIGNESHRKLCGVSHMASWDWVWLYGGRQQCK